MTQTKVVIEIGGRKVQIESIRGVVADGLWRKKDELRVGLNLPFGEDPVGSTVGFGITLPAFVKRRLKKMIPNKS